MVIERQSNVSDMTKAFTKFISCRARYPNNGDIVSYTGYTSEESYDY